MNITQHVERASRLFPSRTALWFEGTVTTYAQLDDRAGRAAAVLRTLGPGFHSQRVIWCMIMDVCAGQGGET